MWDVTDPHNSKRDPAPTVVTLRKNGTVLCYGGSTRVKAARDRRCDVGRPIDEPPGLATHHYGLLHNNYLAHGFNREIGVDCAARKPVDGNGIENYDRHVELLARAHADVRCY